MVAITLPDGAVRQFDNAVNGLQVAENISKSLAKKVIAMLVNGEEKDLSYTITQDATVALLTPESEQGLDILRHDAAHVLAEAVQELFPDVQVTIGPVIEDGFYYDFYRETPFSTEDLAAIEQRMKEIVDRNETITREEWDRDEAIRFFEAKGEKFKAEIIRDLPAGETISLYRQGHFIDLCRGPHLPSTGKLGKAFKLMRVSGAYWRGDAKNAQLQRIYGTAWVTEKDLQAYLTRLEEAAKRDHRKIGREMELFHLQEEAVGQIFWHDKGWTLYQQIEQYIRRKLRENNYIEVKTPILVDRVLWEKSGHWDKFRDNMFTLDAEDKTLAIKPMNCPCHVQIFNQRLKSYRELPLRMAEFGSCHRNESSGSMHGLMRVRGFTQDDAHIFCTEDQITSETIAFCDLLKEVYADFGFTEVRVKFSDRPQTRAGSDAIWDKAENALKDAVNAAGLEWTLNPGEGAFYGPKLEFVLRDAIGRDWQCGTLQVDFVLPERLDAEYVASEGHKARPVMLHRAILGSFERFIGILIEQYAGKFPLWLAPVQVAVATITNDVDAYAEEVDAALKKAGLRTTLDITADKIGYKVRAHSVAKVPVILVLGKQEAEQGTVAIRRLGSQATTTLPLQDALALLRQEAATIRQPEPEANAEAA